MLLPLVSIVLPTFNGSRYLNQAIDSVLAQTHEAWELIVVDDASTDATPEIARQYAERDARIRVVRNAQNQRLPRSLNIGFREARGEFLTWTSDDNAFLPSALAEMTSYLQDHSDIGLVYTHLSLIDEHGVRVGDYVSCRPEELPFRSRLGACFLYRREVYETIGDYDTTLFLAEDYDYWLRVSSRFGIALMEQDLYLYRRHAESLSESNPSNRIKRAADQALVKNLPQLKWVSRRVKSEALRAVSKRAWARREYNSAIRTLAQSALLSPGMTSAFVLAIISRKLGINVNSLTDANWARSSQQHVE